MPYRLAAAMLIAATTAQAEQIIIEADSDVKFLRCTDMYGTASCEFVAEGSGMMRCIAIDGAGEPIASAMAFIEGSNVMFQDLDATIIDRIACTRR